MNLRDLFDLPLFEAMTDAGFVRVQHHPFLPLSIANYTEKAQYGRVWNPVTTACRGLIFDEHGEVVARPFPKFFNYGDPQAGLLDMLDPAWVTDKLDGSLGIVYPTPQGAAVATRGSFNSEQALHATSVLRSRYDGWSPPPGLTALFEIIYPTNRVVVDYGDADDLFLLAVLDIETGRDQLNIPQLFDWPGPSTQVMPYPNLHTAIQAQPRRGVEGLVVAFQDGRRVKIKQDDYVALHRIVTGLNARTVWEWLGEHKDLGELCADLPDEFHPWVGDVAGELVEAQCAILTDARSAHRGIVAHLDQALGVHGWTRRDYAHLASARGDLRPYLFLLLDDEQRRAEELAWKAVKPSADRALVHHGEAVA